MTVKIDGTNGLTFPDSTSQSTAVTLAGLLGTGVTISTTAPANTMVIATTGKIGINTNNTPAKLLDINLSQNTADNIMATGSVNDLMIIRAPFGPGTVSNNNAKWGIRFYGRNDTNESTDKSAALYAVSEEQGGPYNRWVGMAIHTSSFDATNVERMRITHIGNIERRNVNGTNTNDHYVDGFFAVTPAASSYVTIFTANIARDHEAIFYEMITFGDDWGGHSSVRCVKRGYINGSSDNTSWGAAHSIIESVGQWGANIASQVTWSGNTVTFKIKLDDSSTPQIRGYVRLIGHFTSYSIANPNTGSGTTF
jgi:hypothetical protein